MSDVERRLAEWIATDGPHDVPSPVVERVIAATRTVSQRRWGLTARTGSPQTLGSRLVLALILTLGAVGLVVAASFLLRGPAPTPLPPIVPDARLDGVRRATSLVDGRVLLLGETGRGVFDPGTGRTSWLRDGDGLESWGMVVSPLTDGRVLLAGGGSVAPTSSVSSVASVFDPEANTFTPVRDLTEARGAALVVKVFVPSTVTLPDGRALIVGGSVEQMPGSTMPTGGDVFDPVTGTFTATPPIPCPPPSVEGVVTRVGGRIVDGGAEVRWASLLPDGRVLLACEEWPTWPGQQTFLAWDVTAGTFARVDPDIRAAHQALPLADGTLLLWEWHSRERRGDAGSIHHYTLARYDPASGQVRHLAAQPPAGAGATLLADGRVLLAGGWEEGASTPGTDVLVFDPCTDSMDTVGSLTEPRAGATVVEVRPGEVLVLGGEAGDGAMNLPAGPEAFRLPPAARAC